MASESGGREREGGREGEGGRERWRERGGVDRESLERGKIEG